MPEGYIYILTNPSFPDYVKIGSADNVLERVQQLNKSECIPFAFRLYAYYKVNRRLVDLSLHGMIDSINENLRSIEEYEGRTRTREFYNMTPATAYGILHTIAYIDNLEDNLVLVSPTNDEIKDEEAAEVIRRKGKRTNYPKMDWLIDNHVVNIGDKLYLINHPEEKSTIVDKEHVEYQGERMSFNQFGCRVTGWQSIQIYAFAKIDGSTKTLSELRKEKMIELGMMTLT